MRCSVPRKTLVAALVLLAGAPLASLAQTSHRHDHRAAAAAAADSDGGAAASRHVTMEELHRLGGTPRGWKFTLPEGDAARGKQVFVDAGCFKCHAISDAGLPDAGAEKRPGPDLTGMGAHHPAEYFAESILAPNAVIVMGPDFTGTDGLSIMPSYADSLSVEQLLDVVTFLRSQSGGGPHAQPHGDSTRESVAGDYRVRFASVPVTAAGKTVPGDRFMIFVTDRTTGEPVPYLPVRMKLNAPGKAARVVPLAPTMGADPFHYGATVVVPDDIETIDVAIGPTTMRVTGASVRRYRKPVTVTFEWP
jgi:mono/diheme cytochrome c family protein